MSEDKDLELYKQKKLLEMRRIIIENESKVLKETKKNPIQILKNIFVGRAFEVWSAAENQYPEISQKVAIFLARMIDTDNFKGVITGEQLFWLFKQLGIHIRLKTQIRLLEDGKFKSIAEKLKET